MYSCVFEVKEQQTFLFSHGHIITQTYNKEVCSAA